MHASQRHANCATIKNLKHFHFLPLTPKGGSLMPPGRVTAPGILEAATLLPPLELVFAFVFVLVSA